MIVDANSVAVLLLLDLTAAFRTVNCDILFERLKNWVGLSDQVLAWFESYITKRCLSACMYQRLMVLNTVFLTKASLAHFCFYYAATLKHY